MNDGRSSPGTTAERKQARGEETDPIGFAVKKEMKNKLELKSPNGMRECSGYLIYKLLIPVASGSLIFFVIKDSEIAPVVSVPLGILSWHFWFNPIFTYMSAPLWNSLYQPCPKSPEDSGTVICDVYISKNNGDKFFTGIVGELLPLSKKDDIRMRDMDSYRMHSHLDKSQLKFNRAQLKKIGSIEAAYSFISHTTNKQYMDSCYNKVAHIKYKLPVYSYNIIGDISTSDSDFVLQGLSP